MIRNILIGIGVTVFAFSAMILSLAAVIAFVDAFQDRS